MMAGLLNLTVETLLNQQIELIGPAAVSLDSLWRAADSPTEQSPRRWMELAAPLLAGFSRYLSNLPQRPIDLDNGHQLLWIWEGEDGEPWRTGDIMTQELLARVYAAYLDSAS
jgi:hypothetical protein